jgi:hypothetical protein
MTKIEKKRGPRPIYRVEKKVRSLQAKDSTAGAHGAARCTVDLVGF